jgi:hypothetical protein
VLKITFSDKIDSAYNLIKSLLEFISGFCDNWYYLGRIGVYTFISD